MHHSCEPHQKWEWIAKMVLLPDSGRCLKPRVNFEARLCRTRVIQTVQTLFSLGKQASHGGTPKPKKPLAIVNDGSVFWSRIARQLGVQTAGVRLENFLGDSAAQFGINRNGVIPNVWVDVFTVE